MSIYKNGYYYIDGKECYYDANGNYQPNAESPYANGARPGVTDMKVTIGNITGDSANSIRGVDISSYQALKQAGVKFYDEYGNEASLLKVLSDYGVNYIRLRIWNDCSQQVSWGWGGGNSNETNDIATAKEAAQYGMRTLIDFHYADWWCDPSHQYIPSAWQGKSHDEMVTAVSEYTTQIVNDFKNAGIDVGMVQIGNEITNGFLDAYDKSGWQNAWNSTNAPKICDFLKAGTEAVKAIDKNIQTVVHIETPKKDKYQSIMQAIKDNGVDYDILGSSFYPYWQGLDHSSDFNDLYEAQQVALTFGKEFCVMETAWPFTLEDGDGCSNSITTSDTNISQLYSIDPQGQADELLDVYNTVLKQVNGLGAFYWEIAWIPVKAGRDNWDDYNSPANRKYGTESGWDNQAFFNGLGQPLNSLLVYRALANGPSKDDNNDNDSDNDYNNDSDDDSNVQPVRLNISLDLWDGNPGTLNTTNQTNFENIQNLFNSINQLAQSNPLIDEYKVAFDTELLSYLNRNARVQFLANANLLAKILPQLVNDILMIVGDINYTYEKPVIPTVLYFDKTMINSYWQAVTDDLNLICDGIYKLTGGQ